jgi:Type IV secretory system Conjugative DNA transfer
MLATNRTDHDRNLPYANQYMRAEPRTLTEWEHLIVSFQTDNDVSSWVYHQNCSTFVDVVGVGGIRLDIRLVTSSCHLTLKLRSALKLAWSLWHRGLLPLAALYRCWSQAAEVEGAAITAIDGRELSELQLLAVRTTLRHPYIAAAFIERLCRAAARPWAPSGRSLCDRYDSEVCTITTIEEALINAAFKTGESCPEDERSWDDRSSIEQIELLLNAFNDSGTVLSVDHRRMCKGTTVQRHLARTLNPDETVAVSVHASRNIGSLSAHERCTLMAALLFSIQQRLNASIPEKVIVALTVGDQACVRLLEPEFRNDPALIAEICAYIVNEPVTHVVGRTLQMVQYEFGRFAAEAEINRPVAALIDFDPWLSVNSVAHSKVYALAPGPYALALGGLDRRHDLYFTGEQSLITIAPPGAGKTRGFVIPNLLTFQGSVIILDIKGECYEQTAAHRRKFSDVHLFAPENPAESGHTFNPLQWLSRDPEAMVEDARVLADVIVATSPTDSRFFDDRARDLLVSIIVLLLDRERRTGEVPTLAAVHRTSRIAGEELTDLLQEMAFSSIPALNERATELVGMIGGLGGKGDDGAQRTVLNIFETLRQHLSVFEGDRVRRITSGASSWDPADMRHRPITVYIRVSPSAISTLAPLLRLVIACHLQRLMPAGSAAAKPGRVPVLAMLDEMPQLGAMRQIETAIHVGRSYGLRTWLFAQHIGQLEHAYGHNRASALMNSCGVQIWMNPIADDAQHVSHLLGFTDDDGATPNRRLVSASTLTGPEYRDRAIIKALGEKPARVTKASAREVLTSTQIDR